MADAPESEEEAEAAAKAKKKKMIVIGLVGAGLLYQFVLKGSPPPEEDLAVAEAEVVLEEGDVAPIEELVVNLADPDELHYLRVGVAAVLNAEATLEVVEPQLPKVSDVVIDVLSTKTFEELRQPGATTRLKDEISLAVREVFEEDEVVRVIFTTFVMQ